MTTCHLRTLRVAILAALGVALTGSAHRVYSDAELSLPVLGLAFAGLAVCSWLLTAGRPCVRLICAWMVATQIALYVLFDRPSTAAAAAPAALAPGLSPGAMLAHLLAALGCTLLLWRGQATLSALGRLLARGTAPMQRSS